MVISSILSPLLAQLQWLITLRASWTPWFVEVRRVVPHCSPSLRKKACYSCFMKTASPTLLPLLRSEAQGEIIARIMLSPDQEQSLSEIAEDAGVSISTATREVDKLVAAGLVTARRVGTARLVQADQSNPAFGPLADLLAVTYGPVVVLERLLCVVRGVDRAYLYGSYAARRAGEAGSTPRDIDVLVVGDASRAELLDVSVEAGRRVRREVNIRRMSPSGWADEFDPFVTTVKSRPLIELDVGDRG